MVKHRGFVEFFKDFTGSGGETLMTLFGSIKFFLIYFNFYLSCRCPVSSTSCPHETPLFSVEEKRGVSKESLLTLIKLTSGLCSRMTVTSM